MHTNIKIPVLNNTDDRSFIDLARREQIIQQAIETIASLGYSQTSLAKIAGRARISIGVITYHFSGKDELINQIVLSIFKAGSDYMTTRIKSKETAAASLREYIESNVEFISQHPEEMLALGQILPNFRDEKGDLVFDLKAEEPIIESLQEILKWGQKTGEFRVFNPRVMAITIRRAIDGIPVQLKADPDFNAGEYAGELATIFENACRM